MLCPVYAGAEYNIYLKNGSVISGVRSYEASDEEVAVYFGTGSMAISKKDILKIEGSEAPDKDIRTEDTGKNQAEPEKQDTPASMAAPSRGAENKSDRLNTLRSEIDTLNSEIAAVNEQEKRLVTEINDRIGRRSSYNLIQLKQLEKEVEPLRRELSGVQQKKQELIQRKSALEAELRPPKQKE